MPTTRNLKSVDIVAFDEGLSEFAFIQVKSTDRPKAGWPVHTVRESEDWQEEVKAALSLGSRFFYIFVALPSRSQPEPRFYVVPSAKVARMVVADFTLYLQEHPRSKAKGQLLAWCFGGVPKPVEEEFAARWDLLGI